MIATNPVEYTFDLFSNYSAAAADEIQPKEEQDIVSSHSDKDASLTTDEIRIRIFAEMTLDSKGTSNEKKC